MIPEIVRYKIPAEQCTEFEEAYRAAETLLQSSLDCEGYELIRSQKDLENYILTIWWKSSDAHLQGFRKSPLFPQFLALIRPFIPMIQEMEHYQATGMTWRRALS